MGFELDFWDYATFAVLFVIGVVFLGVLIFLMGLPGRIAIARKHPEADAVYLMGWLGFLAVVPWIQAFIWAFKPVDVIDLRYLPKDVQRETDAMMARLKGELPPYDADGDDAGGAAGPERLAMMAGFLVLAIACFVFWLVFLKFKWLRMTPGWVFGFSIVVLHLMLIFVIGLRFVTPQSASAKVVQHTIQLIPRLSEPTLVTAVLVEDNTEVKKDQPLFQFDRTIYAAKVAQLEAQLAAAKQNVDILKANVEAARSAVAKAGADSRLRRAPGQDLRTARARGLGALG